MTSEEKINEMKSQLEAENKYKVLTQAEYEALLLLSNPTGGVRTEAAAVTAGKSVATATSIGIGKDTAASTAVTSISLPKGAGAIPKYSFAWPAASSVSTPGGLGAIPKFVFPGSSPVAPVTPPLSASYIAPTYSHPKLPIFSGQEGKGEVTYEVWSYEVKCLQNSYTVPDHVLLQAIRTSLRGDARTMITTLGERATVTDILGKLDGFYGMVSTCETLMQNFYSDYQKDSDTIVQYGSRLEQTLSRALRNSNMESATRDAMLRTKFWTGLSNQQLKSSTRHLFDSIKDFQLLLREIRKVEQEEASNIRPAGKQKVVQQHYGQTSDISDVAQLSKQLNEMMGKMKAMEKKIDSQQQLLSSKQFSFSNEGSQQQYGRPNFNRGRGNSFDRGYGRETYRGSYRGTYRGQNRDRGRGYQNSDNNSYEPNNLSGGSQGRNRGGANGRGTSRGGYSGRRGLN